MEGTNYCVKCERDFYADIPCCCDSGTYEDGSHEEGYCSDCCRHSRMAKQAGIGGYERCDC